MQIFVKIGHMGYHIFSIFKTASIWYLGFLNYWSHVKLGGLICIAVTNFTKIGQMVAETSLLTIFKITAIRHLGFLVTPLARCEVRLK